MSQSDIQFARVNASTDGDNTVVAAVAAKKIRVLGYALTSRTAGLLTIKSSTTSTLAELDIVADTPFTYDGPAPAFETVAGELLNFNVAAGVDVVGHLAYVLID